MNNTIQLSVTTRLVPTRFDVVQYATGPDIEFYITDYTPTGSARLYIEKPSGAKVYNDCSVDGQTVTFTPTTQAFAEVGENRCQLEIMDGDSVVLSFIMYANVTENIIDSSAVESTDEFTALEEALNTVSGYDSRITANENNIATNASDIATNTSDIASNTADIATNASNIATNTADIATNTADIATNTADIATNAEKLSVIGNDYYEASGGASKSIASATSGWTNLDSITLPPGLYIVTFYARFTANANGWRQLCLSKTQTGGQLHDLAYAITPAVNGTYSCVRGTFAYLVDTETTYYLNVSQNSGATLTVTPRIQAIRIK